MNIHPDSADYIESLKTKKLIPFIGSAISMFEPTRLPSGENLSNIIRSVFEEDYISVEGKATYPKFIWENISLERILDLVETKDKNRLYHFLYKIFSNIEPNSNHELISYLLIENRIPAAITVNWDECIEMASRKFKKDFLVVSKKSDLTRLTKSSPLLFKLHGSIRYPPKEEGGVIYDLSQESTLGIKGWKKELLKKLVKGKDLLFIGYSGFDFDICPELKELPFRNLYWVIRQEQSKVEEIKAVKNLKMITNLEKKISPEARELIKVRNGVLLICDLRVLFERIAGALSINYSKPKSPSSGKIESEIKQVFRNIFSYEERLIWLIMLLNNVGVSEAALKLCKRLLKQGVSKTRQGRVLRETGVAYFNFGKYLSSSKYFEKAIKEEESKSEDDKDYNFLVSTIQDRAEALRCYGNLTAFLTLILEAFKITVRRQAKEKSGHNGLLPRYIASLYLRYAQLFEFLALNFDINPSQFIMKELELNIEPFLKQAEQYFKIDDNFLGIKHVEYRRARLKGRLHGNPHLLSELATYYKRLGYLIGIINVFRDLSKSYINSGLLLQASKDIKQSIRVAEIVGDYPGCAKGYEIWGEIELKKGNMTKAKKYFKNSWKYYQRMEVNDVLKVLYRTRTAEKVKNLERKNE